MRSLIRTDQFLAARRPAWWRGAPIAALLGAIASTGAQQPSAMLAPRSSYVVSFVAGGPVSEDTNMPVLLRQPITLKLKNVRVEQALKTIASRAGISLTYSRAVVP